MNKQVWMSALGMLVACSACNPGSNTNDPNSRNGSSTGGGGSSGNGNNGGGGGGNGGDSGPYTGAGWTFMGRVSPGDSDPNAKQTLSWPASGVVSSFTGTSSVTVNVTAEESAAFVIVVDGQSPIPVTQDAQQVNGLDPKATHTLKLFKRNESLYGDGTFSGITLGSGGSFVAPPTSNRRIEVVGDSISAGYGDLGSSAKCVGAASNEDSTQAYGPIAAASLNADVHVIAWSGQGVYRSNTNDTSVTMPQIWKRADESDANSAWDFKWVPQAVVINLGTNDFFTGTPDATAFESAYTQFISDIRGKYGKDTQIYCAVGPMIESAKLPTVQQYIKAVISAANSGGDANVHYLEFPTQTVDTGTGAGAGCDYHPNLTTQRSMALDTLVPALKKDLGW